MPCTFRCIGRFFKIPEEFSRIFFSLDPRLAQLGIGHGCEALPWGSMNAAGVCNPHDES